MRDDHDPEAPWARCIADISMSLDGYVAGPDADLEDPLGRGGEGLHEWAFGSQSWRETHGREGGEANADSDVDRGDAWPRPARS